MDYVLYFLVGSFLANSIPHLTNGISGRHFHTPFASPPGKGFSSPVVNVIWACVNLGIAAFLYHRFLDDTPGTHATMSMAALGFVLTAIGLAWWFGRVNEDRG